MAGNSKNNIICDTYKPDFDYNDCKKYRLFNSQMLEFARSYHGNVSMIILSDKRLIFSKSGRKIFIESIVELSSVRSKSKR